MTTESVFPKKQFFDHVYRGPAPWDIGAPQPDLMQLIEEFPPAGRILDLGSGTGDLAIGLAQRGHTVLGVEFVETAVEVAGSRLRELDVAVRGRVDFEVGDALHPSSSAGDIGAVVDSGFYHLFDPATRLALIRELAETLPPGGRYYMLGFAITLPAPDVPREVTEEEIRRLFSAEAGWRMRALRPAVFHTTGFDEIPALGLCAERVV